ncbi:MAG: helix-turn-helix transcriptional regulator [Acutalibacteraceae bacterium]|nr:helix-turn-helix transcriptional regulator [Acutalibacteraceae bacterium]
MTRSYNKLLKLMIDKKINKTQLREQARITSNAMAKISKDEPVSIEVLEKICGVLECNIEDIVEIMPEDGDAE